jgi:outer membrane receptor protein involved in Fe transport
MTEQKTPVAAAVFASLYPASQALAQEAPPVAATRLEPVTVTATRRSEELQDVSQSITALSTEFIEKQALTNLYSLVEALPSVNMVSLLPGRNSIIIRGIATGSAEYRIDSQVSVYLDEQPMTTISQQADVNLIDIERVEVLPGPQGTLFGSSSQAGTIRYVTNKPDISGYASEVSAMVGTTKDGDESYDVSGWLNIPVSDNFAMRVVGFWSEEGGYVDNVEGLDLMGAQSNERIAEDDQNVYRTVGGRVSGLWTINENWDLLATGIYQRGDTMGTWETDAFLGDNQITRFYDEWRDDSWYTAAATLRGNLGFAELAVTASYFNRKIDYQWDNTNYAQWRSYYYSGIYDTGALHSTIFNWQKQNRWAYEARLTSQGESKLQWMAGAFFEDVYDWWEYGAQHPENLLTETVAWETAQENCLTLQGSTLPDLECPIAPTPYYYYNRYSNKVKQLAFFGEVNYALTDKWTLTGGARWFEYDRDMFDMYQVPFGLPAQNDPDANGLRSVSVDNDTTYKAAIEYHASPDVMYYVLYSEGFRLGGDNSPRAASTGEVPATYGPDTLSNYEAGIKSQWLDQRLQLNASLFYMVWDDIQIHFSSTSGSDNGAWWIEGNINGGEAVQQGLEFNGSFYATERLSFEWSIFLADPEFTEDSLVPNSNEVWIAAGTTMPVSVKEKYWASVDYTFPDFLPWRGDLWTRFSYSYQGKTWDSLSAIEDHVSDDLVDVRSARPFLIPEWQSGRFQIGFTSETGWDAALIVNNVFDENGINNISGTWRGEAFGDPRYKYTRTLQRPRTISLSFTKKW